MISTQRSARAIVTYEAKDGHVNWKLEDVVLQRDINPDEVLVRMVAAGICHTDIVYSTMLGNAKSWGTESRVLGHEGAGYAEAVGSEVKNVKPGDPLLLSFASCAVCRDCKDDQPAYCQQFGPLNVSPQPKMYSEAAGQFFGQSSFASLAIVKQCSVVNVSGLVDGEEELKMFSPLGCGFQTGFGTIENLAAPKAKDAVVILGLGSVGLLGVMAAKKKQCRTIIGIDRFEGRLALAKEIGATHVIDTSAKDFDLPQAIRDLTDGFGADVVMDTSGNMGLINDSWQAMAKRGQMITVGMTPLDASLSVHLLSFLSSGKMLRSSIEGGVIPAQYIPKMIQWHKEGKLPVEKLIKYYKVEDYALALEDMHKGSTIKPILVF